MMYQSKLAAELASNLRGCLEKSSDRPLEVGFGVRFASIVNLLDLLKEVRSPREQSMRGGKNMTSLRHARVQAVALEQ